MNQKKQKAALALKKNSAYSIREICEIVGISRNTYYKYTREGTSPLPKKRDAPPQEQRPAGQPTTEQTADPPTPDFLVLSYSLLHLDCLQPSLAKKQRSPNKSIGEATRQQTQSLIQELILTAHNALNDGMAIAQVFNTLFAKQQLSLA